MPTTAPTARKQYGLRWLFAVTALVGVLLFAWQERNDSWFALEMRLVVPRISTQAGVESRFGRPHEVEYYADGSAGYGYRRPTGGTYYVGLSKDGTVIWKKWQPDAAAVR